MASAGGEARRISNGKDNYANAYFPPDGKALYALREAVNDKVYNLTRLIAFEWPNPGKARVVTQGWDRAVNSFEAAGDSKTIYALAEEHGHAKLYAIPAGGACTRWGRCRKDLTLRRSIRWCRLFTAGRT